ncbi:hypothetical protein EJB05_18434, partial [Eragrostis curvula]
MPALPAHTDVATAGRFYWSLRGLARPGKSRAVPRAVDHNLVIGFGLDQAPCAPDQTKCQGFSVVADMNRHSFQFPKSVSLLEALFKGIPGVYSEDFPGSHVVYALSLGRAPAARTGHGFRGSQRPGTESVTSTAGWLSQVPLN